MGLELESSRCDRHFFAMCGAEIDEMVGLTPFSERGRKLEKGSVQIGWLGNHEGLSMMTRFNDWVTLAFCPAPRSLNP